MTIKRLGWDDAAATVQVVRRTRASAAGAALGVRTACVCERRGGRASLGPGGRGGARGAVRHSRMPFDGAGVVAGGLRGSPSARGAAPPAVLAPRTGCFLPRGEGSEPGKRPVGGAGRTDAGAGRAGGHLAHRREPSWPVDQDRGRGARPIRGSRRGRRAVSVRAGRRDRGADTPASERKAIGPRPDRARHRGSHGRLREQVGGSGARHALRGGVDTARGAVRGQASRTSGPRWRGPWRAWPWFGCCRRR